MSRENERRRHGIDLVLSLVVGFHFLAVLLAPNRATYVGHRLAPLLEPYVDGLGIGTTWSFFAPNPGPPPVFVEYELQDREGEFLSRGVWPPLENPDFFRDRHNRKMAIARFMIADPKRAEKMMGSYFCARFPEATVVKVWRLAYTGAHYSEVESGKRKLGDDFGAERTWIVDHSCENQRSRI